MSFAQFCFLQRAPVHRRLSSCGSTWLMIVYASDVVQSNRTGSVRVNVVLIRVSVAIVAVEKQ
jgi:hypothetical protein